jgi:fucose permease
MSLTVAAVESKTRSDRFLLVIAFLAFVGIGLPAGLLGVGWPSIRETFDRPQGALGIVLGAVTVGYLVSSFAAGRVLVRLGVGMTLALSCLTLATGLVGNALAPTWWVFVGLGVLIGLGSGTIDTGLNIYVATYHDARTMNWLHACFGVGATVGPGIMTAVLGLDRSWRWGYAIPGLALLLLTVVFLATRDRWPAAPGARAAAESEPGRARSTPYLATLRLWAVWLGILFFVVHVGVEVVASVWSYSLFTEERGVSEATAGLWISVYWGCLTLGRIVFGWLVGVARMDVVLRACMATVVLGGLLIWANLAQATDAIGLALIGLGLAPIFPSMIATTPERLGPDHTANGVGFQVGAAVLGGALIPGLVGVLADQVGLEVVGPALILTGLAQFALYLVIVAQASNAAARAPLPPNRT